MFFWNFQNLQFWFFFIFWNFQNLQFWFFFIFWNFQYFSNFIFDHIFRNFKFVYIFNIFRFFWYFTKNSIFFGIVKIFKIISNFPRFLFLKLNFWRKVFSSRFFRQNHAKSSINKISAKVQITKPQSRWKKKWTRKKNLT